MESVRGIKLNAITDKKMMVGQLSSHGSEGVVISQDGISFTLCACTHGYAIGYVLVKENKVG